MTCLTKQNFVSVGPNNHSHSLHLNNSEPTSLINANTWGDRDGYFFVPARLEEPFTHPVPQASS